jgi:hypothetical protein
MKAIHPYVNLETSTFEALTQFKDGRERTVLHFAAQNWAKDVVVWIKELIEQEKVKKEDKDRFVNGKDEKGGCRACVCGRRRRARWGKCLVAFAGAWCQRGC